MTLSSALGSHDPGAVLDALAQHNFHAVMVTLAQAKTPIIYVNNAFVDLTGYTTRRDDREISELPARTRDG